jgi:hypothetical protein
MKRDYNNGIQDDVTMFIGTEVEHTPAYNKKTLFVVGVHDINTIFEQVSKNNVEHIYLGANQSFNPSDNWDTMIKGCLKNQWLTTLDFDIKHVEWVLDGGYAESRHFIPQISIKLPYLSQLGYNATLKLDDIGFARSNPGVWYHSLHALQSRENFTAWDAYKKDEPV